MSAHLYAYTVAGSRRPCVQIFASAAALALRANLFLLDCRPARRAHAWVQSDQ